VRDFNTAMKEHSLDMPWDSVKKSRPCRRRGHETLIASESLDFLEPPDVGSYFFNELPGRETE